MIEIFRQKHMVSNVILAFLDHLKPKNFFDSQRWPTQERPSPFSKSLNTPLLRLYNSDLYYFFLFNLHRQHYY